VAPGRVIAGFGVGGEFPGEFTATGADLRARGAVTDEALEVIERLWTGDAVTYRGRWVTLDELRIEPPPEPPPTVWVGGRSDAALRRAVRFAAGYTPYLVSPEQLAKRRLRLGELAVEAGRSPEDLAVGCLATMIPGASVEEAVEVGISSLRLSGLSPQGVRAWYLIGDDASILARLQEYVDAGADHLILGCLPGDDRQVDEFFATCERLLPAARELRPTAG
jgi:alkanesulfonate monooxygenase SsuD/methylene tetrahydromethanopterin reductase-like flavin-dependent oxidoreductase (luciferase family)